MCSKQLGESGGVQIFMKNLYRFNVYGGEREPKPTQPMGYSHDFVITYDDVNQSFLF